MASRRPGSDSVVCEPKKNRKHMTISVQQKLDLLRKLDKGVFLYTVLLYVYFHVVQLSYIKTMLQLHLYSIMQGKYMYIEGVLGTTYSSEFSMVQQV